MAQGFLGEAGLRGPACPKSKCLPRAAFSVQAETENTSAGRHPARATEPGCGAGQGRRRHVGRAPSHTVYREGSAWACSFRRCRRGRHGALCRWPSCKAPGAERDQPCPETGPPAVSCWEPAETCSSPNARHCGWRRQPRTGAMSSQTSDLREAPSFLQGFHHMPPAAFPLPFKSPDNTQISRQSAEVTHAEVPKMCVICSCPGGGAKRDTEAPSI